MSAIIINSILLLSVSTVINSSPAFAQTAEIKDIKTNEDTTISIKKGSSSANERQFEIVEGSGEIQGDPHVLKTTARENWKKACNEWKKEIRENNKENGILILNCNAPQCSPEDGSTICKSEGKYKLKVRL